MKYSRCFKKSIALTILLGLFSNQLCAIRSLSNATPNVFTEKIDNLETSTSIKIDDPELLRTLYILSSQALMEDPSNTSVESIILKIENDTTEFSPDELKSILNIIQYHFHDVLTIQRAPRPAQDSPVVGPGVGVDSSEILLLLNTILCQLDDCCDDLKRELRLIIKLIIDLKGTLTECCADILSALTNIRITVTATLNISATIMVDLSGVFTELNDIKTTLTDCCADLKDTITDCCADLKDSITDIDLDLSGVFTELNDIKTTLTDCCADLKDSITDCCADLKDSITDCCADLKDSITDCCADLKDTITDCCADLKDSITDCCTDIKDSITDCSDDLTDSITDCCTYLKESITECGV